MTRGGTWIARKRTDTGGQVYKSLGPADDYIEADGGVAAKSFGEAYEAATAWFRLGPTDHAPRTGSKYTVRDAMEDYLSDSARRGKPVAKTRSAVFHAILPDLGDIPLEKLTKRRLQNWLDDTARRAPSGRGKRGERGSERKVNLDEDAMRRRRSTANRLLTILKAALNHAHAEQRIPTRRAWESVKPFRGVDGARIRFLSDAEAVRLVNACDAAFRPMVQAALLTGARYGELARLEARDVTGNAVHVRQSKSGKQRTIWLAPEGVEFFRKAVTGKAPASRIFTKPDGSPWRDSHQARPFAAATTAARLEKLTFHELRHTYASRLIQSSVPLAVVAEQLGHSDTRMVSKHYGHLAPGYIAKTISDAWGRIGIVDDDQRSVVAFKKA